MIRVAPAAASALAVFLLAALPHAQDKGGLDVTGPYQPVAGWLKPVEEGWLIHPVAVFADTPDRIFIVSTGATPRASAPPGLTTFDPKVAGAKLNPQLVVVNRNGIVTERWAQWYRLFRSPHKVTTNPYDPERHIWFVDRGSQQVLKFTSDGSKLVMALGEEGVAGHDERHFGRPTDIAFLDDRRY